LRGRVGFGWISWTWKRALAELEWGGAQAAVSKDGFGLFWNPAGIATKKNWQVLTSASRIVFDQTHYFLAAGFGLGETHHWVLGWGQLLTPEIEKTRLDSLGNVLFETGNLDSDSIGYEILGTFSATDNVFFAAYRIELGKMLRFGLTGRWVERRIDQARGGGMGFDVGLQAGKREKGFQLGLVLKDIGQSRITWKTHQDRIAALALAGVGYRLNSRWLAAIDWQRVIKVGMQNWFFGGFEYHPISLLTFRAGLARINFIGGGAARLRAGVGMKLNWLGFDYAFSGDPQFEFQNSHRLSISLAF